MNRVSPLRALTAIAALALGSAAIASPASADDISDQGLWYYKALGFDLAHADGYRGEGVTIAMIDGAVNLEVPTLQGANIDVQTSYCLDQAGQPLPGASTEVTDTGAHGTAIASLLVGSGQGYPGQDGVKGAAPGAHLLTYRVEFEGSGFTCYDDDGDEATLANLIAPSIQDAVAQGADIISISLVSGGSTALREAVAEALRQEVIVVASLSNRDSEATVFNNIDSEPATMNGIVSVLSIGSDGSLTASKDGSSNTSDYVDVVSAGTGILVQAPGIADWRNQGLRNGTSLATPLVAGSLALVIQKYPESTGNQVLQSMIRNTGVEGAHEPIFDVNIGYGTVVVAKLLEDDPSQYDDVNPFITKDDLSAGPSYELIFGDEPAPAVTSSAPETTDSPVAPADSSSPMGLIIAAGVVVFIVIIVIVVIAVSSSRKGAKEVPHGEL